MPAGKIITAGSRFACWTVVREAEAVPGRRSGHYLCRCDCGTERAVHRGSLQRRLSTSCGCVKRQRVYTDPGHKRCPVCLRVLSLSEFGKRPEHSPGAVRSKCKACANERRRGARTSADADERARALAVARQWKRDNRERNLAIKRSWEAANVDKVSQYNRKRGAKWRAANRKLGVQRSLASRAKNPEAFKRYSAQYAKDNAAKCRASYKRYMTRKLQALPTWANDFLIQQFYDCCTERNALKTGGVKWHVDHQVPLQSRRVCGLHVHENLRVIPGSQNVSKGNRHWPDMP